jgi:hypothetical protein
LSLLILTAEAAYGGEIGTGPITGQYTFDPRDVHIDPLGDFHRITYEGGRVDLSDRPAGHPQLPVLSKWLILPDETSISDST